MVLITIVNRVNRAYKPIYKVWGPHRQHKPSQRKDLEDLHWSGARELVQTVMGEIATSAYLTNGNTTESY